MLSLQSGIEYCGFMHDVQEVEDVQVRHWGLQGVQVLEDGGRKYPVGQFCTHWLPPNK